MVYLTAGLSFMHAPDFDDDNDKLFAEAQKLYRSRAYKDAFRIYVELANRGRVGCQRFVGWMYFTGEGVEKSPEDAFAWFVRAAEQGDREATFGAGRSCLLMNRHAEALAWFSRGCDLGFAPACFRLGWMYQHGKGREPDKASAYRYFRKAFHGGNLHAGRACALLLMSGIEGFSKRFYGALLWLKILIQVAAVAAKNPQSQRLMA
jgi:uncharacterized protein